MNCPACARELVLRTVGDVGVDVCEAGCAGVWLDWLELKKLDEPHEAVGTEILDVKPDPTVTVNRNERMNCPKCDGVVMMRHFFSINREVEVDECPSCAGYWLDCGELRQIRSQYDTEAEREAAASRYFGELFDEKIAKKQAPMLTVAKLFRFVSPNSYVPKDLR